MSENSESVILDVTHFDQWADHFSMGKRVPDVKRSTVVHPDKATAEQEAVRLALAHPGKRFAVFTYVGVVSAQAVPSHTSLGGQVITITKPVWQERDL
jgi:hypothetical protein